MPEAIVDLVEESELYRAASKCLASVLYWRITHEVEIPPPSPPRAEQLLIELTLARSLSDAIGKGHLTNVGTGDIDAVPDSDVGPAHAPEPPGQTAHDPKKFAPIAVAAE